MAGLPDCMNACRRCRTNTRSRCQTSPQPQYGARCRRCTAGRRKSTITATRSCGATAWRYRRPIAAQRSLWRRLFDALRTSHRRCKQGFTERCPQRMLAGAGWPELGISNPEMRKMFTRLANAGTELFLKSRGLYSFEMANGQLAWRFGGDLPDRRLAFDWGGVKGQPCPARSFREAEGAMAFRHHSAISYRPPALL